MSQNIVI